MFFSSLKRIVPMTLLYKIKYAKYYLSWAQMNNDSQSKKIYYLDAPDYANLGDQAIAYAINMFAQKYFPDYQFVECTPEEYVKYRRFIKKNIKSDDYIFLTGGGNMGNRYHTFEGVRRVIINDFPNNIIVVFPQSIDYSKDLFGRLSKRYSSFLYRHHRKLFLCARDIYSFGIMEKLYKTNNVFLCPDMVFSLSVKFDEDRDKKNVIGVCLRDDNESAMTIHDRKRIIDSIPGKYEFMTTISEHSYINKANRIKILHEKWREFKSKSYVVTDRLHAMIFSFIFEVPCYVYKNNNKKIEGVYKWIEDCSYIKLIGIEDNISWALNDSKEYIANNRFDSYFDNLAHEIKAAFVQ